MRKILKPWSKLWAFIKELGLTGFVASTAMAALIAALSWLHDKLPWSVSFVIILTGVALFIFIYRQFVLVQRVSRYDPSKFRELGHELSLFCRDSLSALNDLERASPLSSDDHSIDPRKRWDEERRREGRLASAFAERHMAKAVALVATLHGFGIYPPFHISAGAMSRPRGLVIYLGAIGSLLEKGLIEEARKMNDPIDNLLEPKAGFDLLR